METANAGRLTPPREADASYSGPWAIRIPVSSWKNLGALRLFQGLTVFHTGTKCWIQGPNWSGELERTILPIPDALRFKIGASLALTEFGHQVPCSKLPGIIWIPLPQVLQPDFPQASVSSAQIKTSVWKLERSDTERAANIWLGRVSILLPYVETAPAVRMKALRFSISTDGRVIARGTPLPPLPGSLYVEEEGIAVPLGWALRPAATPVFWRKVFASEPADLMLLEPDGSFERVTAAQFIVGARAALRTCLELRAP